jgi:hypothetical protein
MAIELWAGIGPRNNLSNVLHWYETSHHIIQKMTIEQAMLLSGEQDTRVYA